MAKINNELKEYQTIPRKLIFDNTISDRARFLYCYMAAKPNDWDFFLKPMATELGYSIETLRKYINELIENGWLVKGGQENEKGVFGAVEYTLKANKDLPYTENTEAEKFRHGKNPTQHNKDCLHNKDNIDSKDTNKEKEDNKLSSKRKIIDFQAIIDCWNENNGKSFGNVERITDKRKRAIKHILESHGIGQETLIKFFKTLPFADNWLFNPSQDHKNWKPDFDWWISNTKNWFTKGLEGGVHKEKRDKFDMIMNGQSINQTQHECNETIININGQIYR